MSTVAYDGIEIVCDTRVTGVYLNLEACEKVWVGPGETYICAVGAYGGMLAFKDWVLKGCPEDDKPDMSEVRGLVIDPDDIWLYDEYCKPMPTTAPVSIGSGSQFAMGAMLAGADANRAVGIASKLDEATGGPMRAFKPSYEHKRSILY